MKKLTVREEYCIDNELLAQKYGSAARVLGVYHKDSQASPHSSSGRIAVVPFDELGGKVLRKYVSRKNKSSTIALTTRISGSHLLAVIIRAA